MVKVNETTCTTCDSMVTCYDVTAIYTVSERMYWFVSGQCRNCQRGNVDVGQGRIMLQGEPRVTVVLSVRQVALDVIMDDLRRMVMAADVHPTTSEVLFTLHQKLGEGKK